MSRNINKAPFFKHNLLITKKKKWIQIFNKNLIIMPEYLGLTFHIYNGKRFIALIINENMIGYKFGEFIITKKRAIFKKKNKK